MDWLFFNAIFYGRRKKMKATIDAMKMAWTALGGALGAVMGGLDGFIMALILFVLIDYITGVMVAIDKHKLSSEVGFRGIAKKISIFCLVAVASIIDANIIKEGSVIRMAVIFFYLSNEGISILENVSMLGLPIPKKLQNVLEQLKEEEEE
jgi:toxin secretion/phage lysis holin